MRQQSSVKDHRTNVYRARLVRASQSHVGVIDAQWELREIIERSTNAVRLEVYRGKRAQYYQ